MFATIVKTPNEVKLKTEESDRSKAALLANMSHGIRTLLNAILGFTNLITSKNLNDDKKTGYANIIKSSSNQLVRIIFQRFRRAKESGSFKGGKSLGLSITKALVEKMGGEIRC